MTHGQLECPVAVAVVVAVAVAVAMTATAGAGGSVAVSLGIDAFVSLVSVVVGVVLGETGMNPRVALYLKRKKDMQKREYGGEKSKKGV